jgi:hypothetical protein
MTPAMDTPASAYAASAERAAPAGEPTLDTGDGDAPDGANSAGP